MNYKTQVLLKRPLSGLTKTDHNREIDSLTEQTIFLK